MSEPNQPLPVTEDLPTGPREQSLVSTEGGNSLPNTAVDAQAGIPVMPPNFEYQSTLGRGGMGVVYRARQTALKRDVAVKMILSERLASESQVARFRTEVEAVARFQHPNIVQIFEFGELRGMPFCVLEYVDGGTLSKFLDHKPIAPATAARIAECLARAVHYAHQRQILHRDLKPGNILMTADGTPKIADFGLAKHLDDDTGLTQDGQVVGTPKYMAPEQARGEQTGLGPHTDVYALGAILYEMLTGDVPFPGSSTVEVLNKVQHDEPVPPRSKQPRIPVALETICLKCLRKSPADRYSSALMLAQDLERFQAGEPILARPEGVLRRGFRTFRRWQTAVVSIAALLVVALAVALAVHFASGSRKQQKAIDLAVEIQRQVNQVEWSPAEAERIDGMIGRLEELDKDQARLLRADAYERYRGSILKDLERHRLSDDDWAAIDAKVNDLAKRNEAVAADLLSRVRERRSEAIRIIDLEPPFAGIDAVFANLGGLKVNPGDIARQSMGALIVATKVSSAGAVKVEVHFDKLWDASRVGITIAQTPQSSYQFLLCSHDSTGRLADDPLRVAGTQGGLSLSIMRNNIELQRRQVALTEAAVILRATRNGDRLTLQANDAAPLECFDPFPLTEAGAIGIVWPALVSISRIVGTRQAAPRVSNPLEQGNLLVTQGNYEDALRFFQQFRATATDLEAKAEARYKIAVCLSRLKRFDEAAKLLESVDDAPTGRWGALSLYQLWLAYLEMGDIDKGSSAFRVLKAQYPADELLHLIPIPDLLAVWAKYDFPKPGLLFAENVVERMRMLVDISDLLRRLDGLSLSNWAMCVQMLDRAYQLEGKPERALELLMEALKNIDSVPVSETKMVAQFHLLEDYLWLLGLDDRQYALLELAKYKPPERDQSFTAYRLRISLAFHRIRLLAQGKQWAEAEKEIDACWQLIRHPVFVEHYKANHTGIYYFHSTLHIMRGLIREQLGDVDGAMEIFRKGTRAAFRETVPLSSAFIGRDADSNTIRDNLYMATRTGTLSDAEMVEERDRILTLFAGTEQATAFAGLISLPPEALRKMWSLPNGRELIRKIIFREMNYADVTWGPVKQLMVAVLNIDAVAELTPEHEKLLRKLADRLEDMVRRRKIGRGGLVKIGICWTGGFGAMGPLGWDGFKPLVPKEVAGDIAYVLGHRYVKLKRTKDARQFFQIAAESASEEGVREFAKRELERLTEKGK